MAYLFDEAIDVKLDSSEYSEGFADVEEGFMRKGDSLYYVSIGNDSDVEHPDNENPDLSIACFHPRYINHSDFSDYEDALEYVEDNGGRIYPLEAYIHSGIAVALQGESSSPDRQWDVSSAFGAIVMDKEFVNQFHNQSESFLREIARGIASTYNDVLSGNCYVASIKEIEEKSGKVLTEATCSGFIGDAAVKDFIEEQTYTPKTQLHDIIVNGYKAVPDPSNPDVPKFEPFSAYLGAPVSGTYADAALAVYDRISQWDKQQDATNQEVAETLAAQEKAPCLADGDRRTLLFAFTKGQEDETPYHTYRILENRSAIQCVPDSFSDTFHQEVKQEIETMRHEAEQLSDPREKHHLQVQAEQREFAYLSAKPQWQRADHADKQTIDLSGAKMKMGL